MGDYFGERRYSVTRRQRCRKWNEDATGAFTGADLLAAHFI